MARAAYTFDPGIYEGIENHMYHSSDGISSSGIKQVLRSPGHYWTWKNQDRGYVPALDFGTAVHAALEGERELFKQVAVLPSDINRQTKVGREQFAEFMAANAKKAVIKAEDLDQVVAAANSCRDRPIIQRLMEGVAERSVYWLDDETGELCKVRPDRWLLDIELLVDWKTCIDARLEAAQRAIYNYHYHVSAAMYLEGTHAKQFLWVFIEKTPPYGIQCLMASTALLADGHRLWRHGLGLYAKAKSEGRWDVYQEGSEYPDQIQTVDRPRWAKRG